MVLIEEDAQESASPLLFTESIVCVAQDDHQTITRCIRGLIRHHMRAQDATTTWLTYSRCRLGRAIRPQHNSSDVLNAATTPSESAAKREEAIKMTPKIKDFIDAYIEARGFIDDEYPQVKRIDFGRTWEEKGVWTVGGEITLKTGLFFTITR